MQRHAVTGAATRESSHIVATCGELFITHMPKQLQIENCLHECQLFASVTLALGCTVGNFNLE